MRNEEAERQRVTDVVEHVLEELGVTWVDVELAFTTVNKGSVCETTTLWEYRTASMQWVLSATIELTDRDLRRMAVHEVVHVLVAPMESQVFGKGGSAKDKACEFAVESVARAILEVLP